MMSSVGVLITVIALGRVQRKNAWYQQLIPILIIVSYPAANNAFTIGNAQVTIASGVVDVVVGLKNAVMVPKEKTDNALVS